MVLKFDVESFANTFLYTLSLKGKYLNCREGDICPISYYRIFICISVRCVTSTYSLPLW